MPRIINNLSEEKFYGTVISYNIETRELEVFIPKLMPLIPKGHTDITLLTNLGKTADNIEYRKNITTTSTITAAAYDATAPLPKEGSIVEIVFIDGRADKCYWNSFFKPTGLFDIIDEEKYTYSHTIKIGEKEVKVDTEDEIEIQLPDGYDVIVLEDEFNPKHKIIQLSNENTVNRRLGLLEYRIGNESDIYTDEDGKEIEVQSSGLYKKIENLQDRIIELEARLNEENNE